MACSIWAPVWKPPIGAENGGIAANLSWETNVSLLFHDRKGIYYDTKTEVTGGIQSDHIGPWNGNMNVHQCMHLLHDVSIFILLTFRINCILACTYLQRRTFTSSSLHLEVYCIILHIYSMYTGNLPTRKEIFLFNDVNRSRLLRWISFICMRINFIYRFVVIFFLRNIFDR